ncbi:hypothetical protein LG651_02375 [Tamlana sp. 62-3]|uniref:HTH luxR-type domain-containing protein n=1 Tax=Neotamlana sargassicola TaxID=2883125 RepID=A0A9X1L5U7_9FLAO|nr:hypothetical protein [Tamlana sargassicola]MCB4807081.1 hypothetical protein [Tamlana sargassicola]
MRCTFLTFFYFSLFFVSAQHNVELNNYVLKEEKVASLIKEGLFEQALLLNIEIVEDARKENNHKIVISGYAQIANILCIFGEHLESLRYLELAENSFDKNKINDFRLKVRILAIYGRNFAALKINNKSLEYYNRGVEIVKTQNLDRKKLLSMLYVNKADVFLNTPYRLDSSLVYLHKAIRLDSTSFKNAVVANYYLKQNLNIDSAKIYLNRSKALFYENKKAVTEYQKSIILQAEANFYKATGAYSKAIYFYEKALAIYTKMNKYIEIKLSYKLLSETHEELHNEELAHEYLLKYAKFTDSINAKYTKNVDSVINNFLEEQETNYKASEKKLSLALILAVIIFFVIIISIIYYFRVKKQRIIFEKEQEIELKHLESEKLKEKLNEAFNDVVQLAKNNDPAFLTRFQEVYPEVCEKLLLRNSKLVNTELILCAMIWLNFSSKDIALYTNVQPKTVQTKKYRLRKKLNIPEDENVYTWLRNI